MSLGCFVDSRDLLTMGEHTKKHLN